MLATAPARVVALPVTGCGTATDDVLAVEAPLEVRLGGKPLTVLMRTPGHDEELVTGFLFSEGAIADADELISVERPTDLSDAERGNVVNVSLMTARRPPGERLFSVTPVAASAGSSRSRPSKCVANRCAPN